MNTKRKKRQHVDRYGLGGDIASGALSGAATGSALGPWGSLAGAVIGGVSGLIKGKAAKEEEERLQRQEAYAASRAEQAARSGYSRAVLSSYGTMGIDVPSLYAFGGQLPGMGVSDVAQMLEGPSHEEGGIPMPEMNAEFEGGELIEKRSGGAHLFSKRIKLDPSPYKKLMK